MVTPTKDHDKFSHRPNWDGTFDSICRECFVTVATAKREADLEKPEKMHACDPWTRQRFGKMKREEDNSN